MIERLYINQSKNRNKESRIKFFNGLYAEYSGLVLSDLGYMDSKQFIPLLDEITYYLDEKEDREHPLYCIGSHFLKTVSKNETNKVLLETLYGDTWEAVRFQHLVRLGADIMNAGLSHLPRATLVGALLYQKEKLIRIDNGLPT